MLNLNARLIDSKIKIEDYLRIREDNKNINTLEEYNKNIRSVNSRMKEINLITEALEEVGVIDVALESQIELKQLLNGFLIKLKNGEVDRLSFSYIQYTSPIYESLSTIKNEYGNAWKEYYDENYKGSISLLGMLNIILEDYEIIGIKNSINKFSKKWPINIKDLEELQSHYKKAHKKIEDLNLNDNIQRFLEKLLNNEMRLSDIDSEIYNWLETNDLDNRIKLKI